ncbi:MAG: hypothetical protein ACP5HC_09660 [Caldisericum sp.]
MDPNDKKIIEELEKIARDIETTTIIQDPWHKGDDKWKVELAVFAGNGKKVVTVIEYRIFTEDDICCSRELGIDPNYVTEAHKMFKTFFVFDYNEQQ